MWQSVGQRASSAHQRAIFDIRVPSVIKVMNTRLSYTFRKQSEPVPGETAGMLTRSASGADALCRPGMGRKGPCSCYPKSKLIGFYLCRRGALTLSPEDFACMKNSVLEAREYT